MDPAIETLKKLTLWELVLLGLGAVFAIANLPVALSQADEPALDLFFSLSLLGMAIFVVFGGQFRGQAFFILLVFVSSHVVMSYSVNVMADNIVNQNLPPGVNLTPVGSIRNFLFDATVDILSLLVAAKLTFSGATKAPAETPAPHAHS